MVESRWFRRAGPAVAALGGIALIATTTVGRPAAPGRRTCVPGRRGSATRRRGAGIGSIRSSARAPGPASGWSSGVPASAAPERSIWMPSRSRPVRSAARPWSARMTAVVRGSRWSTRPRAAPGRWSTRATSSGRRRSRRMARPSTSSASTGRPAPTSASGDGRSMAGRRPSRVLPPIAADARFGPTWITTFAWDEDGRSLAVQSCGEIACRVRILDTRGGDVRLVADPALGDLVGFDGDRLVAHGACRGLPCPLLSVDVVTGSTLILEPAAGQAVLSRDATGRSVVVHELGTDGEHLRMVGLDGRDPRRFDGDPDGRRLVAGPARSGSDAEHDPGLAPVRPGRTPADRWITPTAAPPRPGRAHRPARRGVAMISRKSARAARLVPAPEPRHRDRDRPSDGGVHKGALTGSVARQRDLPAGRHPRVRLAHRRRATRTDPCRGQRGRGRYRGVARVSRRALRVRRGRDEPDRLRDRHLWRERAGVFHSGRPGRVHDVVPRAWPRFRLGHAQVVPDVHERAERLLRRRDGRAR